MGSWNYDKNKNNTRCDTTVSWVKNADSVSFSFSFTGYCYASSSKFSGNSDAYVRVDVDGNIIGGSRRKYAGQKTSGTGASGSGWVQDYHGSYGPLTLAGKNTAYTIEVKLTGNFSDTGEHTETFTFTIPVYINDDGTVKALEKAYANVSGSIKECTVYLNVDGVIKQIS